MDTTNNLKPFPFFAGQCERKLADRRHVLSPLPVDTNMPAVHSSEQLTQKTDQYIEVGGLGGLMFQTQLIYALFLMSTLVFLMVFFSYGGLITAYKDSFDSIYLDGQWHRYINWIDLIAASGLVLMGPLSFLYFAGDILLDAHRVLSQTIAFRFHRQRREVMMSRWNSKTKTTDIRFFPWESICAMVGDGRAMTGAGMMGGAVVFIGANDENKPGYFWASMQFSAINVQDAAAQWEMIRRFMEEGPEAIGEPKPVTFEGLVEQYCREREIPPEEFPPAVRFWWWINGTHLGLWRIWYETRRQTKRAQTFPEVDAWSQPIPESEWAKPSDDLNYYNRKLAENEYARGLNLITIGRDLRECYGEYVPSGPQEPTSLAEIP